jgi:Fic family protein
MTWNWQQSDWPNFSWDESALISFERDFLQSSGVKVGVSKHLPDIDRRNLSIELLSFDAVDSSAIEGEHLDRWSVQSSIQRQFGIATDRRRPTPAEAGIAAMMVDLYSNLGNTLTEQSVLNWHHLLMNGRTDIANIVRYRTDTEPMQIVSGAIYAPRVHYEAPPASQVPAEMIRFIDWFARTEPAGSHPLPAITRAGLAHLWFECIHPFEDGNGRIGRAIAEKALAQGLASPVITGMAGTLLKYRKDYYAQLEGASRTLDVSEWMIWFAEKAIDAQARTLAQIEFLLSKARVFDRLRGKLNARQEKVLLRIFAEGPEGFKGGLSAANYITITGAPTATVKHFPVFMASDHCDLFNREAGFE